MDVAGRAEGHGVIDVLGGAIDQNPLGAVEGQLLAVHGEEVLAKELAEVLEEEVAKTPDYRKISADGLFGLGAVDDIHPRHGEDGEAGAQDQMVEAISMKRWVKVEISSHSMAQFSVESAWSEGGPAQARVRASAKVSPLRRIGSVLGVFFMCRRQKYPSRLSPQEIALRGSVSGSSAGVAGERTQVVAEA